jgi:hypothetical protein
MLPISPRLTREGSECLVERSEGASRKLLHDSGLLYILAPLTDPAVLDASHDRLPSYPRVWQDTPRATASLRNDHP